MRFPILRSLFFAWGMVLLTTHSSRAWTGSVTPGELSQAIQSLKPCPPGTTNHLILSDGIFFINRTIRLPPAIQPLIIEAESNCHPVISGGRVITHWEPVEIQCLTHSTNVHGQVWEAKIPELEDGRLTFRQLWVNGQKAIRARNPNAAELLRLRGWDKKNQTALIPASSLAGIHRAAGLEMVINQVWEIAVLRVDSIKFAGTNAVLKFKQPESELEFGHPWPPVIVNSNYAAPFYLANALALLDSPGEWFADTGAGKIYYWPRAGEDMNKVQVIAPVLETLVKIEGSLNKPTGNIQFKGITFAHTGWLRPSQSGHVPLQAGMYLLGAKKLSPKGTPYHLGLDNLAWIGRPPAAVTVKNARDITFENCNFEHLASAGLDFESGAQSNVVQGCTFRDIGGNGLQLGEFSQPNVETHVPFDPSDERVLCSHTTIANNLFTDCANEDWGGVGIGVGYARHIHIEHNEVCHLPYTGISVGWGWTKHLNASRDNMIFANHIHHVGELLGDLGGIYTLSAQPGTVIAENYIHDLQPSPYAPDSNHWFYLYLDEGSSYITVRDNWCPSEKFLKNANGPGNFWTNNGPQVSEKIKSAAGIEPAFRSRFQP